MMATIPSQNVANEGGNLVTTLSLFGRQRKLVNGNLISSLFSRELVPEKCPYSGAISNRCYRQLIRKSYIRASRNPRRVLRTIRLGTNFSLDVNGLLDINPVYDISYSPVVYQDHRVLAVGDELGYLSIVKVGFGGGTNSSDKDYDRSQVFNRGVSTVPPDARTNGNFENEEDESEPRCARPVLYSLAWNNDGNKILTGYGDGSLRIWDLAKSSRPACVSTIYAYEKSLKRVAWCQETLISCSRTNEISVHDLRMRKPLANMIDCSQLNSKLTDISVLNDVYVVASSSNQSAINLFDLRFTYKLYKRIKPVQSYDLSSPGYSSMKYDQLADDGIIYALGTDCIIRSADYRTGNIGPTYQVPGGVDFFTKIDVDKFSGILVSGGKAESAWGFDLESRSEENGSHIHPFCEINESKKSFKKQKIDHDSDDQSDKENQPDEVDAHPIDGGDIGRASSAVALGTRRSFQDCSIQIACGGDNSTVFVYD